MPWRLFGRGEKGVPSEGGVDVAQRKKAAPFAEESRAIPVSSRVKAILVPVDGSPASLEAVALGCNLARRPKAKVYLIHVIEVPRAIPLDAEMGPEAARGEELLLEAEQVAREADCQVEGELLQARDAGQAVVDEAVARDVDLIIVGVEYEQPVGEFQMDRFPQYLLRNAPCAVWLLRRAPGERGFA